MAIIERHPGIEDCILELSLEEILSRGGVADLFENGHLILVKDYRLDFDSGAIASLSRSTDAIEDPEVRRKLKKLTSPYFFKGKTPKESGGKLIFSDPVRQAIYDVLCRGERDTFERAARALRNAHDEVL